VDEVVQRVELEVEQGLVGLGGEVLQPVTRKPRMPTRV
jgi:hypothetical protein